MEAFSINLIDYFKDHFSTFLILGGGGLAFQGYKLIKKTTNPVKYIEELYNLADLVIEQLDNRFIDKIRNKRFKEEIQKDIIANLELRKKKINELIQRVSD